ncbi:hypothetical protein R3P38DRAFT_3190797 [Favolaschia claudopus]|uniref:Uncharacterized protein n=1 Tax=Favolaschia claudopus TaxID=2862362 RepID=A0AAW0BQ98_9AGAR
MPRLTKRTKRDPSAAAEAKRVASAKYYQQNADMIREKRRTQMAEKRAEIKAKRRRSDKPKPTQRKCAVSSSTASRATPKSDPHHSKVTSAEHEASQGLALLSQQRGWAEHMDSESKETAQMGIESRTSLTADPSTNVAAAEEFVIEEDVGVRTISEVAGCSESSDSEDSEDFRLSPILGQEAASRPSPSR